MRIDGKGLADQIIADLASKVKKLHLTPTLSVILVGQNEESLAYIRQKKIATERLGGKFILEQLPEQTISRELTARIAMYNEDPSVHGLIVQRPLPMHLGSEGMLVVPQKDIDGFVEGSPYPVPIAEAIFIILEKQKIYFRNKQVVIVGRGETAGKPIAKAFAAKQCATSVVHSLSPDPIEKMKQADILISCVGKERVVTAECVKPGAVLMSVGLWQDSTGKTHGDYEEEEIKDIAAAYTPTPGGVGPVNVACLMQNLVMATQKLTH